MSDRERVIESLRNALARVQYGDMDNVTLSEVEEAIVPAIGLLKEQEPVKPIKPRGSASWICGACKIAIGTSLIYHFCPWCGRKVKQE